MCFLLLVSLGRATWDYNYLLIKSKERQGVQGGVGRHRGAGVE